LVFINSIEENMKDKQVKKPGMHYLFSRIKAAVLINWMAGGARRTALVQFVKSNGQQPNLQCPKTSCPDDGDYQRLVPQVLDLVKKHLKYHNAARLLKWLLKTESTAAPDLRQMAINGALFGEENIHA